MTSFRIKQHIALYCLFWSVFLWGIVQPVGVWAKTPNTESTGEFHNYMDIVVLKPLNEEFTYDLIQCILMDADEPNISFTIIELDPSKSHTLREQAESIVQSLGADAVIWFSLEETFKVHLLSYKQKGFERERDLGQGLQQNIEKAGLVVRGWIDALLAFSSGRTQGSSRDFAASLSGAHATASSPAGPGASSSQKKTKEFEKELKSPGRVWLETALSATSSGLFTMGLTTSLAVQNKYFWAAFAGFGIFYPMKTQKTVFDPNVPIDESETVVKLKIFKVPVFMGAKKFFPLGRFLLGLHVAIEFDILKRRFNWDNNTSDSSTVHPALAMALSMAWRLTARTAIYTDFWGRAVLSPPSYEVEVNEKSETIFQPWAWQPYINVGVRTLIF